MKFSLASGAGGGLTGIEPQSGAEAELAKAGLVKLIIASLGVAALVPPFPIETGVAIVAESGRIMYDIRVKPPASVLATKLELCNPLQ